MKDICWFASTKEDMRHFPKSVCESIGYALYKAQLGERPMNAKPLKGFGGANVLEIVENFKTNTYRAVYTVRFVGSVHVLHVFQKKSKSGRATPQTEIDLIKRRLRVIEKSLN